MAGDDEMSALPAGRPDRCCSSGALLLLLTLATLATPGGSGAAGLDRNLICCIKRSDYNKRLDYNEFLFVWVCNPNVPAASNRAAAAPERRRVRVAESPLPVEHCRRDIATL